MSNEGFLGNMPPAAPGRDFDPSRATDDFIPILRSIVTQPVPFFAAIPRRGNYVGPLVFALICAEISALIGGVLSLTTGASIGDLIVTLIRTPISTAIGLFIGAAIAHVLVYLIVGSSSNSGFEATFRVVAYSSVTSIAAWIPIIGPLISIYGIYLAIVGIREIHQTTTSKAVLVVLIPTVIIIVLALLAIAVIGAALLGMGALNR